MIVLGLFAALFTIVVAGCGVTISILAHASRINLVECACLSWLLGCGVVSLLLWICGAFCSGLLLQAIVALLCLLLAIAGWRATRQANVKFDVPRPATTTEWILAGIVAIEVAVLVFVSFKHTLGWDGLLNWELKARYAFLNGGNIPSSYYSSSGRAFSHPEYPLAIPFTELWLYLWMGEPNQFWVKIIFPLFYAACAPLLALLVSRLSGKRWIGLLIAVLLPFVPSISASPGGIVVGYVDVPLSVFYLAALGYLLLWFQTSDSRFIMVFAACSALLPWTKSEGIILWVVLVLLGFVLSFAKRRLRQFSFSLVPGLIVILVWRLYLRFVHLWPHSDFAPPSWSALRNNIGRLHDIFGILFAELSERSQWSAFWLITAVAVIYLLASRKLERIALATAVVGPVLLYSLIYVFSTWSSYSAHMTSSVPRLLLHVMPAGWLAIGLALSQSKRETQAL
ncbi:MAG TPA: hypothetical protein VNX27_03050 [Chthoniobacterales bacterium]|jgi:hypothetical protein|nr:hypothetical protein [Chthoniobacterales bacterium]